MKLNQLFGALCPILLLGLNSDDCFGQQPEPAYAGRTANEWSAKISRELELSIWGYKRDGFAIIDDASPDALPVLCELLSDKNRGTRTIALIGIAKLKKKGKPAAAKVLLLLHDKNAQCRY